MAQSSEDDEDAAAAAAVIAAQHIQVKILYPVLQLMFLLISSIYV